MSVEQAISAAPPEPAPDAILYRSDRVEVRFVPVGDDPVRVVTFEPYHDDIGLDRSGFGQNFFRRERIAAIHVLSATNEWFNYPEMDAVLAAIRAATAGSERLLAYGSSMGGYAAIRFADAIGATHVLALSPQYTIDRRRMPAERRWYRERQQIAFRPDYNDRITCAADVIVAYDSALRIDAAHSALIERDVPIRHLRLPHSGHPVAPFLNEVGLLQPLARRFAYGDVDPAAIEREAASLRDTSASWLVERSAQLPRSRGRSALDLARKAYELAPDNETVLFQYGMRLHEARDYAAAIDAHRRATERLPHPGFLVAYSKALFFGGRPEEALHVAEATVRAAPQEHVYVRWRGRVRATVGDHAGAAEDYATVFRLKPSLRATFGVVRRHLRLWVERLRGRPTMPSADGAAPPDAQPADHQGEA